MASYKEQLNQAQQEAQNILQRANEMAEVTRSEIVAQAKKRRRGLWNRPGWSWRRESSAIAAIRNQAADLVVAAASKVLARTLTSEDQEHLLKEALAEVERL